MVERLCWLGFLIAFFLSIVFSFDFVLGDRVALSIIASHNRFVFIFVARSSIFTFVIIGTWFTRGEYAFFIYVWRIKIFRVFAIIALDSIFRATTSLKGTSGFLIAG